MMGILNFRFKSKNQKGFTILELIIATSVFGVITLVVTTGIITIGRSYHKGVITGKTQETARSVSQEISNAFQFSNATVADATPALSRDLGNGMVIRAQCIGNFRYTYVEGAKVSDKADPSVPRHALWFDLIKPGQACKALDLTRDDPSTQPTVDATTDDSPEARAQRKELLGENMRIEGLTLEGGKQLMDQPAGAAYLNLNFRIVYGENDLSPDPSNTCLLNRFGGQFCAMNQVNTTIKKRL